MVVKRLANRYKQPINEMNYIREKVIASDLETKPHRFVVYRLDLDECAKCRKPRKEHLPEDRRR